MKIIQNKENVIDSETYWMIIKTMLSNKTITDGEINLADNQNFVL